jgi:hypothetical protein
VTEGHSRYTFTASPADDTGSSDSGRLPCQPFSSTTTPQAVAVKHLRRAGGVDVVLAQQWDVRRVEGLLRRTHRVKAMALDSLTVGQTPHARHAQGVEILGPPEVGIHRRSHRNGQWRTRPLLGLRSVSE